LKRIFKQEVDFISVKDVLKNELKLNGGRQQTERKELNVECVAKLMYS